MTKRLETTGCVHTQRPDEGLPRPGPASPVWTPGPFAFRSLSVFWCPQSVPACAAVRAYGIYLDAGGGRRSPDPIRRLNETGFMYWGALRAPAGGRRPPLRRKIQESNLSVLVYHTYSQPYTMRFEKTKSGLCVFLLFTLFRNRPIHRRRPAGVEITQLGGQLQVGTLGNNAQGGPPGDRRQVHPAAAGPHP